MLHKLAFIIIPLLVSIYHSGCAPKNTEVGGKAAVEGGKIIGGVPFVKQKDKFCGPAAMASVLEYYGDDITQEEIASKVYTPKLDGALISDMENFARGEGYRAESTNGDIDALKKNIDEGAPVILLVDRGKWMVSVPHYYVVYGYNSEDMVFIVHTGYASGEKIPFERLDDEWEKMNRLMLIVRK